MHGRPRAKHGVDPVRQKEEEAKTARFQSLLTQVLHNHRQRDYSKKALQQNAILLETNPEVYTAWNYRKLAVTHLFESHEDDEAFRKSVLDEELRVVEKALMRNFKSYGAWHHRKWVLQFGLSSLDHEYQLLDRLLIADARNFHGWSYRRYLARLKKANEDDELQYTINKINENFSNYSAWHNRSVLLSKQSMDKVFEENKWLEVLTEEYELVKQAFFTEPEDQSGWFYLIWLLGQTLSSSGPVLTRCWPSNGTQLVLRKSSLNKPGFWSYNSPIGTTFHNRNSLCITLCFSTPVCGVDSTTVVITSSPEICSIESGLLWTPLSGSKEGSTVWTTNLNALTEKITNGTVYTVHLNLGGGAGIFSKDRKRFGSCSLIFTVQVQDSLDDSTFDGDSSVKWPEEFGEKDSPVCRETDNPKGLQSERNKDLEAVENWQFERLQSQIDTCRELLDLEPDSKWTMLTLARLLTAQDYLVTPLYMLKPNRAEIKRLYERLIEVDPTHGLYYGEQLSDLRFDEITCNMQNLCDYWWEVDDTHNGWLRFHNLSLSKLGHFDRILWVQRIDLSNNKLQSLEGIEILQLLTCLDLSHNRLSSVSSLWPIRSLKSLVALNVSYNEIGAHSVDTSRYLVSSALNNSIGNRDLPHYMKNPFLWEVLEVFIGLGLKQLEFIGNPIANDDNWNHAIAEALPSLIWLDGTRISS